MNTITIGWDFTGKPNDRSGLLIEQLRRAGIIKVQTMDNGDQMLTISCPPGYKPKEWHDMNVSRMKSFGITAA